MKLLRLLPILLLILPAVACKPSPTVPRELVGNWVTQDAKYQDKTLVIDAEGFVVLIVDEDTMPKAEHIDSMTSKTEAGVTTYVLEASDQEGVQNKFTLLYRPVNGGELRLAHPIQVVWHRSTGAAL